MKVNKIQNINSFCSKQEIKKREFIDVLVDNVKNPRDVQDCVTVPRGIFKAYIYLMCASSVMMISGALSPKLKHTKTALTVLGAALSAISAVYFAKPFAIRGLSPTVNLEK